MDNLGVRRGACVLVLVLHFRFTFNIDFNEQICSCHLVNHQLRASSNFRLTHRAFLLCSEAKYSDRKIKKNYICRNSNNRRKNGKIAPSKNATRM